CQAWGVGATGPMLVGGAMLIERNSLNVLGHGIVTSPSSARILANDIAAGFMRIAKRHSIGLWSSGKAGSAPVPIPAPAAVGQIGVALVRGALPTVGGFATIDGNTISGLTGLAAYGIEATATIRIDRNLVRGCGGGIALLALGSDVMIAENQILKLVAPA